MVPKTRNRLTEKSMPSRGREHQWNEPPPFATPSVPIPLWFSCRDTAGKSARFRVGSCYNPYPSHYRMAFAFSHPHTRIATIPSIQPLLRLMLADTPSPHGSGASRVTVGTVSAGSVRVVTFPHICVGYC